MTKQVARFIGLYCMLLTFSVNAFGSWESISSTSFTMADHPKSGSRTEKSEFDELHYFQNTRSYQDCLEARSQSTPKFQQLFSDLFSDSNNKRISELVGRAMKLADRIAGEFKGVYQRPRPYQKDLTLQPCTSQPKGARSYPSAHAAIGSMGSCILKFIFPMRVQQFESRGKRIAELRVIAGVHHRSDIEAGWTLGQDLCQAVTSDPTFLNELNSL